MPWFDRLRSAPVRAGLVIAIGVLAAFAIAMLVLAFRLGPKNPTDEAARLQALAATGGLLASIVLILVTFAYVVLTGDMVGEARQARLDAVRPALALRIDGVSPVHSIVAVASVGQGTAMDVDVTVAFHPVQPGGHSHSVRWRSPSMASGTFAQFMPRNQAGVVELDTKSVVTLFEKVTVQGTMRDSTGAEHAVNLLLEDLPGWEALLAVSGQRYVESPSEKIATTLEKIAKKLP